jgi:hypothetical protein
MYLQDIYNRSYFAECNTEEFKIQVNCSTQRFSLPNDQIANFTVNRFRIYQTYFLHMAGIVFQSKMNEIVVWDMERDKAIFRFNTGEGFAGTISSVEFAQHYLIAVLKYSKQIMIWDMIRCVDFNTTAPIYNITAAMMTQLGIKYFAPLQVYTSDFHPSVIFIQTTESVIILDLTRNGPILLNQISSPATKEPGYYGWKMAISQDHLVIVNAPDMIEEHNLMDLQSKVTFRSRVYPLYYYTIPESFDLDFSDSGGLIYITAKDKNSNSSVLLVYRAGLPAVSTMYDVFYVNGKY